jgi:hypothetical protein
MSVENDWQGINESEFEGKQIGEAVFRLLNK